MQVFKKYIEGVTQLIYPTLCYGCGNDAVTTNTAICFECMQRLPETRFTNIPNNNVERIFWGRIDVQAATSLFFFNKNSLLQQLMHQLKYNNKPQVGEAFGKMLGTALLNSSRFNHIEMLTPIPLSKKRLHQRGYNQAWHICKGIQDVTNIPIVDSITYRTKDNETQTHKTRQERWLNMQDVFAVDEAQSLSYKNILLVDDVITTGATLETCAQTLQQKTNAKISIATIGIAMH
jgi:ComF family protein